MQSNKIKKFFLLHTTPTKPILNKNKEKFNNIIKGICLTSKKKENIVFICINVCLSRHLNI